MDEALGIVRVDGADCLERSVRLVQQSASDAGAPRRITGKRRADHAESNAAGAGFAGERRPDVELGIDEGGRSQGIERPDDIARGVEREIVAKVYVELRGEA